MTDTIIFIQDIDTGIHRDAAEQDERGKPALIEVQMEPVEGKEHPDVRQRKNVVQPYQNTKANRL